MELFSCRIFIAFIRCVFQFRFCIVDWWKTLEIKALVHQSYAT